MQSRGGVLEGRNLEKITVRSWSAPIVEPPPMAFSPIVIPAVADGVVKFTTNEGITELYDVGEHCVKRKEVYRREKSEITGRREWIRILPYKGIETFKMELIGEYYYDEIKR